MSHRRMVPSVAHALAQALFVLVLVALPALAFAQVTVTGTVTDQQTHQPIPGAMVAAAGTSARATTDDGGRFTLTSEKDFGAIVVTRLGYARMQVAVTDKTQPLTVELEPAAVEMQGLEVTGRAVAHEQIDNAQSTGTLTPQDLGRANGLSLENSINTLPGVFMQSRTPWGGAHVTIRGYYPNFSQNSNGFGSQTFLNDIPVTDASGMTIMDDIDFASLGSVEVIKGPSSSLYGGAIAGTVLLKTAELPAGESSLDQQTAAGTYGLFRTNTTYSTAGDASAIAFNYGHQTYDSFRPNSGSRKDYARFNGRFNAGDKQVLSAYFAYNNSFEQIAGEIDSTDFYNEQAIDNPVYALNRSQIRVESNRIGFTDAVKITDHVSGKTTLFTTTQTFTQPFAHGFNDANRFNFGARGTLGYDGDWSGAKWNGVVGGQFQRTNYTTNGFFLPASRPSDQENYAMNYYAFTEWTAGFPGDVAITVGGTLSKNEFGIRNMLKNNIVNDTTTVLRKAFDAEFTPRASILKTFNDAVSVYGSVSMGYTAPSLTAIIGSDNVVRADLKPEHGTQYEVGSKGSIANRKLSYDLALFDLENTDKLVSQRVGAVSFTTNAGKVRNRGAELTLSSLIVDDPNATLSLLRPWVTYTYSDFKYIDFKSDDNNNAATVNFSDKEVARAPKNVFNVGLDAATKMGVYVFGSYQWVDKAFVTFDNSNIVKSYDLLSAKLGYQRKLDRHVGIDLAAGGDNLLGSTYYSFLFVGPNFTGIAQPKDGGTGDGYIIPAPYKPTFFGTARITYTF